VASRNRLILILKDYFSIIGFVLPAVLLNGFGEQVSIFGYFRKTPFYGC